MKTGREYGAELGTEARNPDSRSLLYLSLAAALGLSLLIEPRRKWVFLEAGKVTSLMTCPPRLLCL